MGDNKTHEGSGGVPVPTPIVADPPDPIFRTPRSRIRSMPYGMDDLPNPAQRTKPACFSDNFHVSTGSSNGSSGSNASSGSSEGSTAWTGKLASACRRPRGSSCSRHLMVELEDAIASSAAMKLLRLTSLICSNIVSNSCPCFESSARYPSISSPKLHFQF